MLPLSRPITAANRRILFGTSFDDEHMSNNSAAIAVLQILAEALERTSLTKSGKKHAADAPMRGP